MPHFALIGSDQHIARLIVGRLDAQQRRDPETGDRVQVETSPEAVLTGQWDPDLLERVIANLVSNALKFSPPSQPVQVCLASAVDSVTLSVTDHGIGIAEDELQRLFSRYGRAGGAVAAGVEGHGLGLFLCKGIVETHGGRIWAESPGAGRGTSMIMALPRHSLAPAAA